jgi:hypothetical protein
VLDATLGYASEAILCAHAVGESGVVHGIEAVPEIGRDGPRRAANRHDRPQGAERRHAARPGRASGRPSRLPERCSDNSYDVVCFDPFFDIVLEGQQQIAPLRHFGHHGPLLPEALAEARRVARRRVLVKAARWSDTLDQLGIAERIESSSGKVAYGIVPGLGASS